MIFVRIDRLSSHPAGATRRVQLRPTRSWISPRLERGQAYREPTELYRHRTRRPLRREHRALALADPEAVPRWQSERLGRELRVRPAHLDRRLARRAEPEVQHPIALAPVVAVPARDLLRLRDPARRHPHPRADRRSVRALAALERQLDERAALPRHVLEEAHLHRRVA